MQQYRLGEGPFGSAYQGGLDDILAAGDLSPAVVGDRTFGLFLGQFDWRQKLRHVWETPKPGYWAYLADERQQHSYEESIDQVHDFRFTGDQHHLLVGGTGAGKFRDALSNMLLYDGSCETSCLIIDPKGEIASTLGPIIDPKDAEDPTTLILDPWNVCQTGFSHALTLLEGLNLDNPHCVKDARVLADAIIVHRQGDGGHWDQTAKNFLTALLLYLATDPIEHDRRHLRRLREIVTMPWGTTDDPPDRATLGRLLEYLAGHGMFGGIVARSVQAFLNRETKERSYILSTIERDTEFVEDPALWAAIDHTTLNLDSLVRSGKRLHVIVPFDYIQPMRSWLRLAIAAYYNACLRNRMNTDLPKYLQYRHIIIDEFPSLGHLDFMVRDIAEARGAGIKYHLIVQSFAQLKGLYNDQWETFVSNCFVQAFGVEDVFTSEYLSKLTGQATVVTTTEGISESTTHSQSTTETRGRSKTGLLPLIGRYTWSRSTSETTGVATTTGTSKTFSTTGRPILMPDEIRRLSANHQLLFFRAMPVMLARREPYYKGFKEFLPSHSLGDALRKQKQRLLAAGANSTGTSVAIPAPPEPSFGEASSRTSVNSQLREGHFKAPVFRPQTREEAFAASRGPIAAAIAGAAAVLMLFVYWMQSDLSRRIELLAYRQQVVTATLAALEDAASEVSRSATVPGTLIERLSGEAVRNNKADIDAAVLKAAGDTLTQTFDRMADAAMAEVPRMVQQARKPDFDTEADQMLLNTGNEAIVTAKNDARKKTATTIESSAHRVAQDAARRAIREAEASVAVAVQKAAAAVKDRILAEQREALRSVAPAEVDQATRSLLASARKEMEEAKSSAAERAVREALIAARPKIVAAARDSALADAQRIRDTPRQALVETARRAIMDMAKRPIANASERTASPAFIARRNQMTGGDPQRYRTVFVPEGLVVAFVKTDAMGLPGILFEFKPRRDKNFLPEVWLDSGRGRVGASRPRGDGDGVFLFLIQQWDRLDLRSDTNLTIAEFGPMAIPESVRKQIWDWRFLNDPERGRQLWSAGPTQAPPQQRPTVQDRRPGLSIPQLNFGVGIDFGRR